MMSLSRTTGYAIQALGCMNWANGSASQISAIAKCARVPRPYLAKIIAALSRTGLVTAKRGHRGGISLARPARDISLLEIVEAVEGPHWLGACLLGFEKCENHASCPTTAFWQRMRREIIRELGLITLAEVLANKSTKAKPSPPIRSMPAVIGPSRSASSAYRA
jgi:Rrf2 family iron-sulfur cluster assembly transcriptional regulator